MDWNFFSSNLPATAATFAAAITAGFGSVKFFLDKAAKVTDFRKNWIETLRLSIAEFNGSVHTIAGRISIRDRHRIDHEKAVSIKSTSRFKSFISLFKHDAIKPPETLVSSNLETELLDQWAILRVSYNKIILHLNPSEHRAYLAAEIAHANKFPDKEIDISGKSTDGETNPSKKKSTAFLKWCLTCAEYENSRWMEDDFLSTTRSIFSRIRIWGREKRPSYHSSKVRSSEPDLSDMETEMRDLYDRCIGPGSALLLAVFATRQLLHRRYDAVAPNIPSIEVGIRVIDTATAIVIKGVWEKIKKGEFVYRFLSWFAMALAFALAINVFVTLYTHGLPEQKSASIFIDYGPVFIT